jgi:hypothetical protein
VALRVFAHNSATEDTTLLKQSAIGRALLDAFKKIWRTSAIMGVFSEPMYYTACRNVEHDAAFSFSSQPQSMLPLQ